MKTMQTKVRVEMLYDVEVEVPNELTREEAAEYAREHIEDISLDEAICTSDSKTIYTEDCSFGNKAYWLSGQLSKEKPYEIYGTADKREELESIWEYFYAKLLISCMEAKPNDEIRKIEIYNADEDRLEKSAYAKSLIFKKEEIDFYREVLTMTGRLLYDRYGLKRYEAITQTVTFLDDYVMEIRITMPDDENATPDVQATLFHHGIETDYTDEGEFFGLWRLVDANNKKEFLVKIRKDVYFIR